MFSVPVLKQDLQINIRRILVFFTLQIASMLLAVGICDLKLVEISDIFWDTIPTILVPAGVQMLLAYEVLTKRRMDGTMELFLSTGVRAEKVIRTKVLLVVGTGMLFLVVSSALGYGTGVYRLIGEWRGSSYLWLNVGAGCLQVFLGGFYFFAACRAESLVGYLKVAAVLPIVMYVIYVVYYWVPQLFVLQFLTVFSLFRQEWFAAGAIPAAVGSVLYLVFGFIFFQAGKNCFYRRGYDGL